MCSHDEINFDLSPKKKPNILFISCFKPFLGGALSKSSTVFIPLGIPLPHSNTLQYYVKREKCKVNDVIFPSGCEACAINLDNKNMKIDIYTGVTSVRSKSIVTAISRYPTGKHEIKDFRLVDRVEKALRKGRNTCNQRLLLTSYQVSDFYIFFTLKGFADVKTLGG